MTKRNLKFTFYLLITICLTLGLSISLQTLLAAWTPPSGSAPSDNVPPPIYVSSTVDQIISGGGDLGVEGDLAVIQLSASGDFYVGTTFYVNETTGQVGIGTPVPGAKLEVSGTVKATSFTGDGSALTGISTGKWSDGAGGVIYYDGGNVGIRTTTPGAELDVNGKIRMRSETELSDSDNIVATKGYVDDIVVGTGGVEVYSGTHSGWTQCQGHLFATVSACVGACGTGYCTYEGRLSALEDKTKVEVPPFAAGTHTWTKPAGVTTVEIRMAGGGGASGGGYWVGRINGAGGGGAYFDGTVELPFAETTYTITVGAGGASVGGSRTYGGPGGTTQFEDLLIARGGGGGHPGINSYVSPGCTGQGGTYTIKSGVNFIGVKENGTYITMINGGTEYYDCTPDGPGIYGGAPGNNSTSIAGSDGYLEIVYYE